jgi:CelD/BcsL family acetyltransferase involved in cellulose biosynthesis
VDAARQLQFREFQGRAGLEQLRPDWERLCGVMAGKAFFHLPAWYDAYLADLEETPDAVAFVGAFAGDTLHAVFPLRRARRRVMGIPFRVVELPEHPHMAVGDFVFSPEDRRTDDLCEGLLRHLEARGPRWDYLSLQDVFEGSRASSLVAVARSRAVMSRQTDACCSLPTGSWEALQGRLSTKFKANLRNRAKRLSKMGPVAFETARTPAELEAAYAAFLEVEASGWKGRAGTAVKQHASLVSFYRRLAASFAGARGCHVNRLTAGGRTVAAQFCLVADGTCHQLKFGYDEEHSNLAPGDLLLEACLHWYCCTPDDGVRTFNLLSGASMFDKWEPEREKVMTHAVFARGPGGALARAWLRLRLGVRSLLKPARKPAADAPSVSADA